MNKDSKFAAGATALLAALALIPGALASDDPPEAPWKTVAASGEVLSRANLAPRDEWQKVRRGNEYDPLTHMRTGRRGKATFTQDRHILIVRSNSSLQLPAMNADDPDSQVFQDSGRVTYEVDGSRFERFEVVTPYLIAGVKGTVFSVEVSGNSASVQVVEGVVEVSSRFNDLTVELKAGEAVLVDGAETERLEIRQAERIIMEKTRREVRFARNRVTAADPDRNRVAPVDSDPLEAPAGTRSFDDPAADGLVEEETDPKRSMAMDEVEKIANEEMKDLDSKKARTDDPDMAADTPR